MQKDDQTWLNVCYVAFGVLVALVGWKALNTVGIQTGWEERYDSWFPILKSVASIVLGFVSVFLVRRQSESREYHLSAITELRKVTWPSWVATKEMTWVVVVVVAIFGVLLAVFDLIWSWVLKQILV